VTLAEEATTQPLSQEQNEERLDTNEENRLPAPNFHALFFKTMFLVAGLLVATAAALYLLKKAQARFFNIKGEADILIIERRSLSPKTQIFLLSVKGKEIIVVESAHQISMHSVQMIKGLQDREIV